jgi:CHAT domain-containing protein/Tfp pilus assembly protein PilF
MKTLIRIPLNRSISSFIRTACLSLAIALSQGSLLLAQSTEPLERAEKQFTVFLQQSRFAEAERVGLGMLDTAIRDFGSGSYMHAAVLSDLSGLYASWGKFVAAEKYATEAVAMYERVWGPDDKLMAEPLNNLGVSYQNVSRNADAARIHYRALILRLRHYGGDSPEVAQSLENLALTYEIQGYYADAEPLLKRALAIHQKTAGPESAVVAISLGNLGLMYNRQGRTADAEEYLKRSLALEKYVGDRKKFCAVFDNLGELYVKAGRFDEAEKLFLHSRKNYVEVFGADHPMVDTVTGMAELYKAQERYEEAEKIYLKAIAANEKMNNARSWFIVPYLLNLGELELRQGRPEAANYFDRVIAIYKNQDCSAGERSEAHYLRGLAAQTAGDAKRAAEEFSEAMNAADQMRVQLSGGEHERGASFSRVRDRYTVPAQFFLSSGNITAGLDAMERGRNRSLLEQMTGARVNLLEGLDPDVAKQLERAEQAAQADVASLEQQLNVLPGQKGLTDEARQRETDSLLHKLAVARRRQVDAYAAIRTASPKFRRIAGQELKTIDLAEVQAWLAKEKSLVLYYTVSATSAHVLALDGDRPAHYHLLQLTDEQAKHWNAPAGKLTMATLERMLTSQADSVVQRMSQPGAIDLTEPLFALWEALIPEPVRQRLLSGQIKHLTVIPDGPLSQLPFEALVTKRGDQPAYLLDAGPAINYAPSATILWQLMRRESVASGAGTPPVLAVGDPVYAVPGAVANPPAESLTPSTPSARYGTYGGRLDRLPYSGNEASWVAEVFKKQGIESTVLKREKATEPAVRASVAGRQLVHMACHGLVDQSYGNFFGALALTPGGAQQAGLSGDGYLSLNEIYGLDLTSCEISILSACQSNFGPQQQGEGTWALSRGFLVAGSRRVVASNWLVDDEAAASLVSFFCANLAKQEHDGVQRDYGAALRDAKQKTRRQEKWQSPYFWATFVLIGPN